MAWEYVKCSEFDEEYRVQMYGPTKTRQWKIDNWSGICDDCKEAAKAILIEENKSSNLTELIGSDKQIAWAMKIRTEFIKYTESEIDESEIEYIIDECKKEFKADKNLINIAILEILEKQSSHWWIESRNKLESDIIIDTMKKISESIKNNPEAEIEKYLKADVEAEAVIKPSEPVSQTIADISLKKDNIFILFPEKNNDFKEIIKEHGYRWNSGWEKKLSFKTEDTEDRIAEVGHALLAGGFCIRVINSEIREKIISENFIQEHTRWISVLSNKPAYFYIQWEYGDNMYDEARRITGARYDKPGIIVPMEHIDEILDFASLYKFKFSPQAGKLIEKARVNKAAAMTVKLEAKEKKLLPKTDGIPVLKTPENVEINNELKD